MHVEQVVPIYFGLYKTNTFTCYAHTINKNQDHYFKREQVQVYGKIWREERRKVNRRMMLFPVIIRHPSPGLCAVTSDTHFITLKTKEGKTCRQPTSMM